MATSIPMPALSPTMKEGTITRWLKKEGDKVSSGQAIAECETDKANLEIESYDDGVLLKILVQPGQSVLVGAPIAWVGQAGETVESPSERLVASSSPAPATAAPVLKVAPSPASAASGSPSTERLRASPLARKMAREEGLDLRTVQGSGPLGRVVKRDVEGAMSRPAPAAVPRLAPKAMPLSKMRQVISERLTEAKPGVPHFYLNIEVDMSEALRVREEAKAMDLKVSVNDIVVKAAAVALRRFPRMNVQYSQGQLLQLQSVDVGVAVAIEDGLLTPVVKDADSKALSELSSHIRELAERAKNRKLLPEEYSGGSITVSNLGMYGIDSFIAVINPPQAAILAVGAVTQKPVIRDGAVVARPMMSVTFSGDHRAIDGAVGALYLKEFRSLLEHPTRLLF